MSVRLRVVAGKPEGACIALHGKSFLIGRDSACQLRPKDGAVAPRHCALKLDGDSVAVEDLGGEGGTLLNGARLRSAVPTRVQDGDRIQVGPLIFEFAIEPESPVEDSLDDDGETSLLSRLANRILQREMGQGPDPTKSVGAHLHTIVVEGVPCITIDMHRMCDAMLPILRRELGNLAERPALTRLILDFRKVRELSPTCADALITFTKKLRARGARLKFCEVQPDVMEVLDQKGILDQIPVFLDCHDAIWSAW